MSESTGGALVNKMTSDLAGWRTEQAYCIFKFRFYTHLNGVHCYHGKLVDIQT